MIQIIAASGISRVKKFLVAHWIISCIAAVVLIAGGWYFFGRTKVQYQFVDVTKDSIAETVSVTGNTTPMKSVSLGFQNTGIIAQVYYDLGDRVDSGAVIAELNTANLSAALQQAKANLAVAQANLDSLTVGTRPEQLVIDRSTVAQSQSALANAITSAYAVSDSAIRATADQLFTGSRSENPELTFVISDSMSTNALTQKRVALEAMLTAWSVQISSPSFGSDPTEAAKQAVRNLTQVSTFLNDVADALTKAMNLSGTNLTNYKSSIASARTNVSGALTSLTSAQTAFANASGELALANAGATSQSIAAQQAQVAQTQAGVANAIANLRNAEIIAPIDGVITQQDAKIGQLTSIGTPLVSIIGTGGFEVDTGVSDTDIGKLAAGNKVSMTLDAFPNETFTGSVFYISPAETNNQGVISYKVKIAFDKPDARFKSGLTTNIDIQTRQKDDVLVLPQYAILQNDNGTFVETFINGIVTTSPITLGIQDQKGNVEILSGVTLGERVVNIGLRSPQ